MVDTHENSLGKALCMTGSLAMGRLEKPLPPPRLLVVSSPGTYVLLLYIAVQLALVTPLSFSFPRCAEFVYIYDFGSLPVPAWRECFSSEEIALWH